MGIRSFVTPFAIAAIWAGCTADSPVDRTPNRMDASLDDLLLPPVLEAVPAETPENTVAIRGNSDGVRIVVTGGPDGTSATSVLPSGAFCHDAKLLPDGETTELLVYSVGGDGRLSDPTEVLVTKNPEAAAPQDPTCSGAPISECAETEECDDDGRDEDCNGYADVCDLTCSGCSDDAFEPNSQAFDVPSFPGPGTYALQICPCRTDWFAFHVSQGERILATASFVHDDLNLNMRLYRAGMTETLGDAVAYSLSSNSTNNMEEIDWIADQAGTYFLNVYGSGNTPEDDEAPYSLTVNSAGGPPDGPL